MIETDDKRPWYRRRNLEVYQIFTIISQGNRGGYYFESGTLLSQMIPAFAS